MAERDGRGLWQERLQERHGRRAAGEAMAGRSWQGSTRGNEY